jgi:hypothetical protein
MPMSSRGAFAAVILATVCLALGSKAALGQRAAAPAPSAEQILARVAAAYVSCRSYSDSGVVKDRYPGLLGHTTEKPFRTAFVRPDRFRFQFVEVKGLFRGEYVYIAWRNGADVRTWWDVRPGVEQATSLDLALGAAAGISGGSARQVASLLMPQEIHGRCLTAVARAGLLSDAAIGLKACYRIVGTYADWPITLWIEKGSYLVRRVDLTTEIPEGKVEETTTYEPILDGEVTEKMLAFDPPAPR